MPLTSTGREVLQSMVKEYGKEKAKNVFYASINSNKAGSDKWHVKGAVLGKKKGK